MSRLGANGRIRRAALFAMLALAVETLSLYWRHPLSFYLFLAAGGFLGLLTLGSFLLSLIAPRAESTTAVTPIDSEQAATGT